MCDFFLPGLEKRLVTQSYLDFLAEQIRLGPRGKEWQDLMAKRLRNFMQWEINAVMRSIRHDVSENVGVALAMKLRAGCELNGICQQREDLMAPCGKFPNPFEGKIRWQVPANMHTHGFKFDSIAFAGD